MAVKLGEEESLVDKALRPKALAEPKKIFSAANLIAVALIAYVILIWSLAHWGWTEHANYLIAFAIGVGTGATELMSRFRDRPFDALISRPGLFYLAVNGGASILALYLIIQWKLFAGQEIQQVLIAGISAMAIFRSGLFTAKVSDQDVTFGPNLLLKILLDALDRTYDRQRAFRRADIIVDAMDGLDFNQSKANLPEVCFSLMQNVSPEERTRFTAELREIAQTTDLSDEARAMALGLRLMGIVGEDTLQAATRNLGSNIFSFRPLSAELLAAVAKPGEDDIIQHLFKVCNSLSHRRGQLSTAAIDKIEDAVTNLLSLQTKSQAILLVYSARRQYGESVVINALGLLPPKPDQAPPPAPPPAPAPDGQ